LPKAIRRSVVRTTVLIILMIALAVPAVADDTMDQFVKERNGRKGLLFNFNGANLSSFDGGIGMKWWLSGSTVLVGSMLLQASEREREASEERAGDKFAHWSIGFAIGAERHLDYFGRFSPYVGGRVGYHYEYNLSERTPPIGTEFPVSSNKRTSNGVSLGLVLGIEYLLTRNMTIGGEYSLEGVVTSSEEEGSSGGSDYDEKRFGVGSSYLVLAIYF
jgi:opacity protein-like surface antigen